MLIGYKNVDEYWPRYNIIKVIKVRKFIVDNFTISVHPNECKGQ
jgi:hypothetical protein